MQDNVFGVPTVAVRSWNPDFSVSDCRPFEQRV